MKTILQARNINKAIRVGTYTEKVRYYGKQNTQKK